MADGEGPGAAAAAAEPALRRQRRRRTFDTGDGEGPQLQETYMHCVPINDLPYRALLARSLTLENLRAKTGCLVCLDGRFIPAGQTVGEGDRPLALRLTAPDAAAVAAAAAMVEELKLLGWEGIAKVPVEGFEEVPPAFGLLGRLRGPDDRFLHHIAVTAGSACEVTLQGELAYGAAAEGEALHFAVMASSRDAVDAAVRLCRDLLRAVRQQLAHYRQSGRLVAATADPSAPSGGQVPWNACGPLPTPTPTPSGVPTGIHDQNPVDRQPGAAPPRGPSPPSMAPPPPKRKGKRRPFSETGEGSATEPPGRPGPRAYLAPLPDDIDLKQSRTTQESENAYKDLMEQLGF